MSDAGSPPPADARPWWAPLLGVGSLGFAGFQVLFGLALLGVVVSGPPKARGLLLLGLAWLLPGILLGVGGAMLTVGARRGRAVSLAAVALGAALTAVAAVNRTAVPVAVADAGEWGVNHPSAPPWALKLYRDQAARQAVDPIEAARNPDNADFLGAAYVGACCLPAFPWYLAVLVACAGPWGARLARPKD